MKGKGGGVVEEDFHRNFQVNIAWLFAFFSNVLVDSIMLLLVWFERSPYSAQLSNDITSGRRDVYKHGQLQTARGQMDLSVIEKAVLLKISCPSLSYKYCLDITSSHLIPSPISVE